MPSWKIALPLVAALLGVAVMAKAVEASASERPLVTPIASFGCTLNDGQLVCGVVKGKKNKNMDDQGDVQMQGQIPCPQGGAAGFTKSKKKPCQQGGSQNSDAGSQGERSCPPGYVVLAEKNKYGSFCEPKEGFPAKAEQCPEGTRLSTEGCVALRTCCNWQMNGKTYGKCDTDPAKAQSDARALADANGHPEAPLTCALE